MGLVMREIWGMTGCMIREAETSSFREEDGVISLEQVEYEIPSKREI